MNGVNPSTFFILPMLGEKQLTEAVTNEHFEKAAEIRDLIKQQYCHELV
jgi:protein-arginine kinase activator protein McsA